MDELGIKVEWTRLLAGGFAPALGHSKRHRKFVGRIDRAAVRVAAAAMLTGRARALIVKGRYGPRGVSGHRLFALVLGNPAGWAAVYCSDYYRPIPGDPSSRATLGDLAGGIAGGLRALFTRRTHLTGQQAAVARADHLAAAIQAGAMVRLAARRGSAWARVELPADPRARELLRGHFTRGERDAARHALADYLEERGDGRADAARLLATRGANPAPALVANWGTAPARVR